MRVMVTGSRNWPESFKHIIWDALESRKATVVIHGDASGADSIAKDWGLRKGVPTIGIPAPWLAYPRNIAGPKRNGWLLDLQPDVVLAFPMDDSRGTWNAVKQAKERGIPTVTYAELLPDD